MGPIGKYHLTLTHTYDGPSTTKRHEIVKLKTDLEYETPKKDPGLPFRVKSAELKASDGTGLVSIDPILGGVVALRRGLTLEGDIVIEIGQQSTVIQLAQTWTIKIVTYGWDTHPPVSPGDVRGNVACFDQGGKWTVLTLPADHGCRGVWPPQQRGNLPRGRACFPRR
jgi:hypothetical protein